MIYKVTPNFKNRYAFCLSPFTQVSVLDFFHFLTSGSTNLDKRSKYSKTYQVTTRSAMCVFVRGLGNSNTNRLLDVEIK